MYYVRPYRPHHTLRADAAQAHVMHDHIMRAHAVLCRLYVWINRNMPTVVKGPNWSNSGMPTLLFFKFSTSAKVGMSLKITALVPKCNVNRWHITEQIKSDMPLLTLDLLTILIRVAIETGITVHLGVIYDSQVTNIFRGGVRELPALRCIPTNRHKPVVFNTYWRKSRWKRHFFHKTTDKD